MTLSLRAGKTHEIRGEEPNVHVRSLWGVLLIHSRIIGHWKNKHNADALESSYKSKIIRRNGDTGKYLKKMRKGNEYKKRKTEKVLSKTFSKISHKLVFVANCENIDLYFYQRSFTMITFIHCSRQESSSNYLSINFSFARTLYYE